MIPVSGMLTAWDCLIEQMETCANWAEQAAGLIAFLFKATAHYEICIVLSKKKE